MKQLGNHRTNRGRAQVYVNSAYDVVAQNGIVMGSVRYAFVNGDGMWCIAIAGHNGMPYHGKSYHETESLFDLFEGEPTWTMPVAQPQPNQSYDQAFDALMSEPALGLPLLTKETLP